METSWHSPTREACGSLDTIEWDREEDILAQQYKQVGFGMHCDQLFLSLDFACKLNPTPFCFGFGFPFPTSQMADIEKRNAKRNAKSGSQPPVRSTRRRRAPVGMLKSRYTSASAHQRRGR